MLYLYTINEILILLFRDKFKNKILIFIQNLKTSLHLFLKN